MKNYLNKRLMVPLLILLAIAGKGQVLKQKNELHMVITSQDNEVLDQKKYDLPISEIPVELSSLFDEMNFDGKYLQVVMNEPVKTVMTLPYRSGVAHIDELKCDIYSLRISQDNRVFKLYTTSYYLLDQKGPIKYKGQKPCKDGNASIVVPERHLDISPKVNDARLSLIEKTGLKLDGFEIVNADDNGAEVIMFETYPDVRNRHILGKVEVLKVKLGPDSEIKSYTLLNR